MVFMTDLLSVCVTPAATRSRCPRTPTVVT